MQLLLTDYDRYQAAVEKAVIERQMTAAVYSASMDDEMCELRVEGTDAIIPVMGPLTYKADFWSWLFGGASYDILNEQVAMAEADGNIKRVVYLFDTPGGEVTGIMEAAAAIKNCKKPTVAVVDPMCASAGLWLASQCNRIVSVPSGEIGSLGVQAVNVSYAEMMKKSGIDVKIFRADISPNKNMGHPYEPRSEAADEAVQAKVDRWGARFVSAVAGGRGVSEDDVLAKFGQGKMLEASDAIDVGLIDGIGDLRSVLAESRFAVVERSGSHKPYSG